MFLEEAIELLLEMNERESVKKNRKFKVGLDIELKVPHLFKSMGIDVEDRLY